jgi:hypothetical protein
MGSALFILRTGMRSTRARSGAKQGILSVGSALVIAGEDPASGPGNKAGGPENKVGGLGNKIGGLGAIVFGVGKGCQREPRGSLGVRRFLFAEGVAGSAGGKDWAAIERGWMAPMAAASRKWYGILINLVYLIDAGAPPITYQAYLHFLNALIRPLVEESWEFTSPAFCNSGRILPASCLPNSTPHWSKVKIFQMTPWTKILCS